MLRTILELALDFAHDVLAERQDRREDAAAGRRELQAKLHQLGEATASLKAKLEQWEREGKL